MVLTITGLIVLVLVATAMFRARGGVNAAAGLGYMSPQWLADYRAHRM
jgi:hypothetical protein